jgi:predicted TPR repeat methyltransferase
VSHRHDREAEARPGDPWALAPQYDAAYYANHLGPEPCTSDSPVWRTFMDRVADAIVSDLGPRNVLDAGCGIGLLVRSLRERGVDAWGIDISEYAISQVPDGARGYCTLGSVTDELERDFEQIVCIEVVEHLPAELGRQAIENLTRHTDSILFSSSPDDFSEPTHVNVQPVDHWVHEFVRLGFVRSNFDATVVAPQAMHLVREDRAAIGGAIAKLKRRVP